MKQHTSARRTRTTYRALTRAPVLVAGTAAAIVGSLTVAPIDAALGADIADQRAMSATAASTGATSAASGDRARNGSLTYFVYIHDINEIVTIGPRGKGKQRLTHNGRFDTTPTWSPNGRRIAWTKEVRSPGGTFGELFIMRADGTHKHRLTYDRSIAIYPAWSPSGRRIVYGCHDGNDFELCTIRRDGTHQRQLTHNDVDDNHAEWASTGRIGYNAWDGSDDEIYTIKPNGTDRRQVTHNAADDDGPTFSPSGAQMAYLGNGDIFIQPSNGGPRHRLTHSPTRLEGMPSWSPNGRRICYVQAHGDTDEIYTSRTNGKDKFRVTHTARIESDCDWGPRPHH